jgi:hypothetical protein
MLNTYLYSTDNLADRLVQAQSHNLRRHKAGGHPRPATTTNTKNREKTTDAAVRMLEKEMDKITDPTIVANANADADADAMAYWQDK